MRYQPMLALLALVALTFFLVDSDSPGQRRGGGGSRGSARGGAVVGPYGGSAAGYRRSTTAVGPSGRSATRGYQKKSYTTARGTTVKAGGAGKKVSGPRGTAGRGAKGVQVSTPKGRTYTKASRGGAAVGPRGTAAGKKTTGRAGAGSRGKAASVSRSGAAVGPYGPSRYSGRSTVAVGHRTQFVASGTLRTHGGAVRGNFVHYHCFRPAWFSAHPNAWRPLGWTTVGFWAGARWATLAAFCRYPAQPVVYDYGTTIVYQDNSVYYNGEPIAAAADYADQALQFAEKGAKAKASEKGKWTSLGVFGMVQGDEKDANNIFQLAINQKGFIRGTYYNALTDTTLPVQGAVDNKTQRAAWMVGKCKDTVYETGIANLTQAQTTMLVHFGKDRTQQWTLVRLDPPKKKK